MGDVIRQIDDIKIGKSNFAIELNHSASGGIYRDVHVQNDKFRLEIPEHEFLQMATCILLAKKNFDLLKKGESD